MSENLIKSVSGLGADAFNLFGLDQFSLSFDIQRILDTATYGRLLYVEDAFDLAFNEDGSLSFNLTDYNDVTVSMNTPAILTDNKTHHIELNYDSDAGVMSIKLDGDIVTQAPAAGQTKTEDTIDTQGQAPTLVNEAEIVASNANFASEASNPDSNVTTESSANSEIATDSSQSNDGELTNTATQMENDNVIYVNNSDELLDALTYATGGEQILMVNNGEAYNLTLKAAYTRDYAEKLSTVTVTSADPEDPITMQSLALETVSNLHFDNVIIHNSEATTDDKAAWRYDTSIISSDHITFSNFVMEGLAEGTRGIDPDASVGRNALFIKYSSDVVFENSSVTNYNHGVAVMNSENVTVYNNEITQMQGDGIRFSAAINTTIENNHIHDFLGSTHDINHMDMIQGWTTGGTYASENIVIRGNILDAGTGWPTQTIFIGNEEVAKGAGHEMFYKDILIEDNVIHNAHVHGIALAEVDGAIVQNNTVLFNEMIAPGNNSDVPSIGVAENSLNVTMVNNVSPDIEIPTGAFSDNNLLINYQDSSSENYVDNLFVNARYGGDIGIEALQALPSGLIETMGVGAPSTLFNSTPADLTALYTMQKVDGQENIFEFDASFTVDANGFVSAADADFIWDFGDGTTATGLVVEHEFTDYTTQQVTLTVVHHTSGESDDITGYPVTYNPILLDIDFENGEIKDNSDYQSVLSGIDTENLTNGFKGDGYHIAQGNGLKVERGQDHIFDLEQFSVSFDMQRTLVDGDDGYIMYLHSSLSLKLNSDGSLTFEITDNQDVTVSMSTEAVITDGEWKHIDLSYDSLGGTMEIYVNGELAAQGIAAGLTQSSESWGLIFGTESWSNSADFNIDRIKLSADRFSPIDNSIPDEESFMPERPDLDSFDTVYIGTEETDTHIRQTSGNDYSNLKGGDESIDLGAGDDWVEAGDGDDFIYANSGYDVVFGGNGNDYVRLAELAFGEEGNDSLYASNDGAKLFGGDGDDALYGGTSEDYLDGGDGVDSFGGGDGDDTFVVDHLDDWIQGGNGFDTVLLDDTGDYDIGAAGFFHSIENFDMTNDSDNTLFVNFGDLRSSNDGQMFIHGDDSDKVILDATGANKQYEFTTEQVEIDGQTYTHYSADNDSWLDVDLYVAENVDVDIVM